MHRRTIRQRKCAPIMVIYDKIRTLAQIDDVSEGGLRLRGPIAVPDGTLVSLHGLGAQVQARVIWCDGGNAGLAFVGDPAQGELRRFIGALMRSPLPNRGARIHGFTELAAPRPALPDGRPLPAAPSPMPLQTGSNGARGGHLLVGSDKNCVSG